MCHNSYIVEIISYINKHEYLKKIIIGLDKHLPKAVIVLFYGTILYLFIKSDNRFFYVALIPLITFLAATAVRRFLNHTRPFEDFNFEPLRPHPKGCSCPSRHATSTAVIAMSLFYINPLEGAIVALISLVVSATRVLTGVHYPRDVILGLLVGYISGYIGFFILL